MSRESLVTVSSPPPPSSATVPSNDGTWTALAPGFRFHPTDEELVSYYLKRKVLNKPIRFEPIGDVDIYKHEPMDLEVFSRLKTRDREWYFFSPLDKKYRNGGRMNRTTSNGYWKATGKDREICRVNDLLAMKKALVFHRGRAPDGLRTNWVMHEYRLVEDETGKNGNLVVDVYVLCRVFHKNNIGPPIGNNYAPFMEEEWAEDRGVMSPGVDVKVRAVSLPIANGNNYMDQEFQTASKDLININEEPPRDDTPMVIEPNHHVNAHKLQDNNYNNHYVEDHEALKREDNAEEDECVLNKEAPLPLLQYKRRRQHETSRTTQDHSTSTTTTTTTTMVDNTTNLVSTTSSAATKTAISALLEFSLMGISDKNENTRLLRPHKREASPPPHEEMVNELKKEIQQMYVERETFKLEMMSAEAMISILRSRIDALRQENDELMKNNAK